MSPIDYLRGVVTRERATAAAAEPSPLPTLTWANAMTATGTCTHEVTYSRCYCHLRKQTTQ